MQECERKLLGQVELVKRQEREVEETRRSFGARLAQQVARAAKVGEGAQRMQERESRRSSRMSYR